MLKEFKNFIIKGNAFDMAIGVIIAGAFGLVIKSLVDHIIMPTIGGIFKLPDFSQMFFAFAGEAGQTLEEAQKAGATVAYGTFINTVINLIIVGGALFVAVKAIEKSTKKAEEEKEEEEEPPPAQEVLLAEIRDLLKK